MPDLRHFPEHVIGLARALLQGELCEFALADALEEIGCPNLAGHFRGERCGFWTHFPGVACAVAYSIATGSSLQLAPRGYERELQCQR